MNCLQNFKSLLVFWILSEVQSSDSTLQQLHILWRHGDRTPISHYKTDPYKDPSYWPEGSGQLTKIGKSMEYSLGLWLKNRYRNYSHAQFYPNDISIFSTDYDRTLMSAQCVLAAFFYPTNKTKFRDGVNWVPTPIHTAPSGSDLLLNVDAACPRISVEIEKVKALPEIIKYMNEHQDVFRYVTEYAGQAVTTLSEVDFIYDTLYIEKLRNLTLPSWTGLYFKEMSEMSIFSFAIDTYSHELKRLRGGPLLKKVTDSMKKKVNKEINGGKIFMYSAHDSTVSILMGTMGIFNDIQPPYAATLMWELHQNESSNFVRLFYQNDSTMASPPYQMTIPGCTPDCPLEDWERLLNDVIPTEWAWECGRPDPIRDHYYILTLSGLCGLFGGVLFVIMTLKLFYHCRNSNSSFANLARTRELYVNLDDVSIPTTNRPYYGSFNSNTNASEWILVPPPKDSNLSNNC